MAKAWEPTTFELTGILPTQQEIESTFRSKHAPLDQAGWSPKRRYRFRYYQPADVYESLVAKNVRPGCRWIDVGGGRTIFPDHAALARELVGRCEHVVAVDPSVNVLANNLVSQRVQSSLEKYSTTDRFDLATMRMVVEHVERPEAFVSSLGRLLKPSGLAIVFTVNRYSPLTFLSRLVPHSLHHPIKRVFWGGEEADTFPAYYRMNSQPTLRALFSKAGFDEAAFLKVDDLSTFGHFRSLSYLELQAWRCISGLHLRYPENVLLGVYRRRSE
jgi:2-polyprenyl-3-methyl-5-hydroxy-6-metoxy-1,4-benzoquinol methylase